MKQQIFTNNLQWELQARQIIPAGCSTLAKSPNRLFRNYSPFCAQSANGSRFTDIDGNVWLDCEMAMGTVVWGHNNPFVNAAIIKQLNSGIAFSVAGSNELQLAHKLLSRLTCFEALKFFKNGADAVYAAIRASRFFSKREKVLSCEYHGWLDWSCFHYYQLSPEACGIPKNITETHVPCIVRSSEILEQVSKHQHQLACVVLCPEHYTAEELYEINTLCKMNEIFVIFDEVTSGIRFGRNGVSGTYNIWPDFLCLSKGLTNGLPLAVCLGSRDTILKMEQLKISNAHSSENLSIAAAIACEESMESSLIWPVWQDKGNNMLDKIHSEIKKNGLERHLHLTGYSGNFHMYTQKDIYSDPFRELFVKQLAQAGIFTRGFILLSTAHTDDDITYVTQIICDTVKHYANTI